MLLLLERALLAAGLDEAPMEHEREREQARCRDYAAARDEATAMEGRIGGPDEQRDESDLGKEIQEVVYGVAWSHVKSVPKDNGIVSCGWCVGAG